MREERVTALPEGSAAAETAEDVFASEVADYLQRTPRQLPSKYFYDDLGSALFEAICRLPWYRVTRAESALLARHAPDVLRPIRRPYGIVELGGGSGEKLAIFVSSAGDPAQLVQLVDVSQAALDMADHRLRADGIAPVATYRATYIEGLRQAVDARVPGAALLVLFLGSNIGNFDPPVAHDLLAAVRRLLRPGDALLLGADLVKPEAEIVLAYDDPLGITAAFNRNLLRRINDELGGTFDLDGFAHRAVWKPVERRIEMHLVSRRRQTVSVRAADLEITFDTGEAIWTESSHKYETSQLAEMGRAAGFESWEQWVDADARFALTRFSVG